MRDAHAHGFRMFLAAADVVRLEDRHVAAMALRALDEASARRVLLRRSDDLEEIGADHEQRVLEAILGDIAVAVADADAENLFEIGDHGLQARCGEANLTEAEIVGHGTLVCCCAFPCRLLLRQG